jgi:hypothetical protein
MTFRLAFPVVVPVGLLAQVANEPNLAYKRYRSLVQDPAAPLADVLKAADDWLSAYEKSGPGSQTLPPYLDIARYYAAKGVRTGDLLPLLEKGVAEISSPGSYTQTRTHENSPFLDDFERALAANVYIQLGRTEKAREFLSAAAVTFTRTDAAKLDSQTARIFAALRFQYCESMIRLAMAEDHKEEALELERAILSDREIAGDRERVISSRDIEAHRRHAQQLWDELGRPPGDFDRWLGAGVR